MKAMPGRRRLPQVNKSAMVALPTAGTNVLVVIEAPGKVDCLYGLLQETGLARAEVFATCGHLCGLPPGLSPLGINESFRETMRGPLNEQRYARLQDAAVGKVVLIASDPDQEGHVIAADVHEAIQGFAEVAYRLELPALTREGLKLALQKMSPVDLAAAIPGRARAMTDRLIGALLSTKEAPAGRVFTALLKDVVARNDDNRLAVGEVTLVVPAADGGRPFSAVIPVISEAQAESLLSLQSAPAEVAKSVAVTPPPFDMGKALLAGMSKLALTAEEAAEAMQEAYERGGLSYPRTTGAGIDKEHLVVTAKCAAACGQKFDPYLIPDNIQSGGQSAHDALHVLQVVPLTAELSSLSSSKAMCIIVAQQTVVAGQAAMTDMALVGDNITVTRTRAHRPWDKEPVQGFRPYSAQEVALRVLLENDLGRPSTWPNHATKFAERNLLDHNRRPTGRARAMAGASIDELDVFSARGMDAIFAELEGAPVVDTGMLSSAASRRAAKAIAGAKLTAIGKKITDAAAREASYKPLSAAPAAKFQPANREHQVAPSPDWPEFEKRKAPQYGL